jgi:hypothetical protein
MSTADPVIVFAGDAFEARLVWSQLKGHGVAAELVDEHAGTWVPFQVAGGGAGAVKVVVAAVDLERAKDVLEGDDT